MEWAYCHIQKDLQAQSIDSFKFMLEGYKLRHINGNVIDTGNFWELSNEVLDRIEGNNYIENKKVHNEYLKLYKIKIK